MPGLELKPDLELVPGPGFIGKVSSIVHGKSALTLEIACDIHYICNLILA